MTTGESIRYTLEYADAGDWNLSTLEYSIDGAEGPPGRGTFAAARAAPPEAAVALTSALPQKLSVGDYLEVRIPGANELRVYSAGRLVGGTWACF